MAQKNYTGKCLDIWSQVKVAYCALVSALINKGTSCGNFFYAVNTNIIIPQKENALSYLI